MTALRVGRGRGARGRDGDRPLPRSTARSPRRAIGGDFPLGTLAVNLSGAVVLGILAGAALSGTAYTIVAGGGVGTYTTFSTWMLESHRAGEGGDARVLWANIAISLVAGLAAVAIGHCDRGGTVTGGGEMLQLRFHFGERDRDGDGPLDAAVMDACARHGVSRGGAAARRSRASARSSGCGPTGC